MASSPIHPLSLFHPTTTTFPSLQKSHLYHLKLSLPPPPARPAAAFLDAAGVSALDTLSTFRYDHDFDHGSLLVRPMDLSELDATALLLAQSFAQSMLLMPAQYVTLLAFLVRQYVADRRLLVPHTATLVGFYSAGNSGGEEEEEGQLACTAEISFNAMGANASPPTPLPPMECPYICNMTVAESLRRRGIGWQLLKACEELISRMKTSRKVYLHCRVIDTGPFNMYTKAGYKVVKTDTILVWLTIQRRKHLMFKELPILDDDRLGSSDYRDNPI